MTYTEITDLINSTIRTKTAVNSISPGDTADMLQDVLDFANGISGGGSRFGIEDNTGLQDRSLDIQNFDFSVNHGKYLQWQSDNNTSDHYAGVYTYFNTPGDEFNGAGFFFKDLDNYNQFLIDTSGARFEYQPSGEAIKQILRVPVPTPSVSPDLQYLATSVNGNYADSSGNITVSGGGSTPDLQSVLTQGSTLTTDTIINADGLLFELRTSGQCTFSANNINNDSADIEAIAYDDGLPITPNVILGAAFGDASAAAQISVTPTRVTIVKDGTNYRGVMAVNITDDYANDAAAATAGINVGDAYHTSGTLKIRLS